MLCPFYSTHDDKHATKIFLCSAVQQTESVISVQLDFQWCFGIAAPSAKTITCWYKQFEEAGCLCKRKSLWQQRNSNEAVLKVEKIFL